MSVDQFEQFAEGVMETVNEMRGALDHLQIELMEAVAAVRAGSPVPGPQKLGWSRAVETMRENTGKQRFISLVRDNWSRPG